jgi:hypothetical protein
MVEIKPSVFPLRESEDKAERSARERNVDLDAAGEAGPISRLLVAGKEGVDGLALAFQAGASFFADPLSTACRPAQILMPGQLVESDGSEAPLEPHDLPLAVRRFHGPVLSFELCERRGLMAQALHNGLSRRIGRDQQTPIAARLLDDVWTFDVSAQLYVGPFHAFDDARESGLVFVGRPRPVIALGTSRFYLLLISSAELARSAEPS